MFSLACNLTKDDVEFSFIKISSEKVLANNVDYSTNKITLKKVKGNNADLSTSEITSKKVRGKNVDISTSKITSKKNTWKQRVFLDQQNYVGKGTWKWRRNSSKYCLRCIDIISTSNRQFNVVYPLGCSSWQCKWTLLAYASQFQY